MNSVIRLQAIAGRSADREAASKEAETTAAILEKEQPKLESKIAELTAKLNGLERDSRLSAKRCEEQSEAVQQLRGQVPEHIRTSVQHNVSTIKSTLGREILDSEIRINELQCCLDPSRYPNENAYLEALHRSFRDAVIVGSVGKIIKRTLSPAWPTIRSSIDSELSALKEKLEPLRAEYCEAMTAATAPLDYYTN